MPPMDADIARILIHRNDIQRRVRELGLRIAADYDALGGDMTIVSILAGSLIFLADLLREMPSKKLKIGLVQVSSYREESVPGTPETLLRLTGDVARRHVLLVDDILDSGGTLRRVQHMVRQAGAASLRTAVLLRKPGKAPPDVPAEYVGFDIEDAFVVGYGLDYADYYRNFPHIAVLRPGMMR